MLLAMVLLSMLGVVVSDTSDVAASLNISNYDWWGPDELNGTEDTSIRPFTIEEDEEMIEHLRYRLNNTIYGPSLKGVGFTYGFNTRQLLNWTKYWAEEYSFTERIALLNSLPQYKTNIQGLDIHFLRVKPNVTNGLKVLPLLLMHGWPGSVREFYEAIPMLTSTTTGYNFTFEVIAPSLPGFGFSDATLLPGLAPPQIAVIFRNLMRRLGHEKFYVQGGDMGSIIASNLATLFPDDILGQHTNFPLILSEDVLIKIFVGSYFPEAVVEPELQSRLYPLTNTTQFLLENLGYFHLQGTRPDNIGVALSDSPAGLLAYIIPNFINNKDKTMITKEDGGLGEIGISRDKLLDNLMIYWINNCISSSIRLYAEICTKKYFNLGMDGIESLVPTWILQAKDEVIYQPAKLLKTKYPNLLGATVLDFGAHYFALQHPDVYTEDVYKAVNAFIEFNG